VSTLKERRHGRDELPLICEGARSWNLGARRRVAEPLIGGAKNSARPRCIHLIRLIRAGFEPFRERDIAGHLSNHRNR